MTNRPDPDKTLHITALTEGTPIGHYSIVRKIGAGGMGEVYLAEDTKLGRKVALKFMPPHLSQNAEIRARFTREAQAAAALDHPNVVTVYEVSEFQGRPFIAMQYVEGETLQHHCREASLSLKMIPRLVAQIADGLCQAHTAGLIHRDIKSANIILDKNERPRILDFGLASVQGGELLTQEGSTMGTAAYMSPEQTRGEKVDHRSDLFSLGVVLYELIAGRLPFDGENVNATLHKIESAEPEPLARYKTGVPEDLQRIATRCLAKSPGDRFQSAADLASELRQVGRTMAAGGDSTSAEAAPSIAVLPFANMSADPENEYFADGLTEELLNVLAKNARLKVTGRTSSFAFKGKQEDLRGIGKKLGVATLLEGSVRKAGNRVRITAQLVNADDGFHLWSETYDRVLEDIFAVQDEIAVAVGDALNVTLLGDTEATARERKVVNARAYEKVLRARQAMQRLTRESLTAAVDLFKGAIDLDPEYASAWAGLGGAYTRVWGYGYSSDEALPEEAKKCAERALALDESLPEAQEFMGIFLTVREHAFQKGAGYLRRAAELAPNNSMILASLALGEAACGDLEEAVKTLERCVELDPLYAEAHKNHGHYLMFAGRLEEAEGSLRKCMELSPEIVSGHFLLALVLLRQGRSDEALVEIQKEESTGYRTCGLAIIHHELGQKAESDRALKILATNDGWATQIAMAHATRGEHDEAFHWLDRAKEVGDSGLGLAQTNPWLRKLEGDARWGEFMGRLG